MNFLFHRDRWINTHKNTNICYNPSVANFLLYKNAFFHNVIGVKQEYIIFEEISSLKNIISNNNKVKVLIILPNKMYCEFLRENLKLMPTHKNFEFVLKHKLEITNQNKKSNHIENEKYDIVFAKEDGTIEWIVKKKLKFNANYFILFHNNFLQEKTYQYFLKRKHYK